MTIPDDLLERYGTHLLGARGRSENTHRIYMEDLGTFNRFLQSEGLTYEDIDRRSLRRYLAWLSTSARGKRGGYARVSVARKLVSLRSFYRYLLQEGLVSSNPIPKGSAFRVKVEKRLPDFLTQREMERVLETPDSTSPIGQRDLAILETLYSTGLRLAELTSLNLTDVDLEAKEARVWGKGSKQRIVLLGRQAIEALTGYLNSARPALESGPEDAVFLNRYGKRLSRRSIEKVVKKYAIRAAASPRTHTHSLRHTFATHMLEGGADLRVVQGLMGHSSPSTTQIYTHVTQAQARKVYMATHPMAGINVREKEQAATS